MTDEPNIDGLERATRRYPAYLFFLKASYWAPVFFLYFNSLLSLSDVLLLESIYYIGVVCLEVPTGYLADRIGPRRVLIGSSVAQMVACTAFVSSGHFVTLALGQILLALGMSLSSGSDTAYHYSVVRALDRADEYPAREGRASRALFLSQASSALVGGAVAIVDLRLAYAFTILSSAIAAVISFHFVDIPAGDKSAESVWRQLSSCLQHARHPRLAWLLAFYIFMTVVNHITHEFYQPFLADLVTASHMSLQAPLAAGIHTALTMVVAGIAANYTIRLRDRLGSSFGLLLAAVIQTSIIAAMALNPSPVIAFVVLLRSVPRGLMMAPLNAEIVPLIAEGRRATYLSLQSLLGRLAFGAVLVALSRTFVSEAIAEPLETAMVWAAVGLILLTVALPISARKADTP